MGRKSTKMNKNIYQESREACDFTREQAAEKLEFISRSRIEKIEYEKSAPHPDEVLAFAECYKNPVLCNYYCSHECPIGKKYVPSITEKNLSQITLEMLATLNELTSSKDRFISIAADEQVSDEELPDFMEIKHNLEKMSLIINSLNLWVDKAIDSGFITRKK